MAQVQSINNINSTVTKKKSLKKAALTGSGVGLAVGSALAYGVATRYKGARSFGVVKKLLGKDFSMAECKKYLGLGVAVVATGVVAASTAVGNLIGRAVASKNSK